MLSWPGRSWTILGFAPAWRSKEACVRRRSRKRVPGQPAFERIVSVLLQTGQEPVDLVQGERPNCAPSRSGWFDSSGWVAAEQLPLNRVPQSLVKDNVDVRHAG